jgi:hypothetical protein
MHQKCLQLILAESFCAILTFGFGVAWGQRLALQSMRAAQMGFCMHPQDFSCMHDRETMHAFLSVNMHGGLRDEYWITPTILHA